MGIFDRFPYSSTHEMNLDFMLGKATEIAESLQEIDTHKEQAEQAAQNAAQSAQSAAQAAQAAAGSQTAAGTSASQAAQHKADAEDAADRAEAASNLADEAVEHAQAAVTQAQTAAQNASTAADGAIASATAAETRINTLAASLPEDFTALNAEVNNLKTNVNQNYTRKASLFGETNLKAAGTEKRIIAQGIIQEAGNAKYHVLELPASAYEIYHLSSSMDWGNGYYTILDSNGNVLETENSIAGGPISYIDKDLIMPVGANTLVVGYIDYDVFDIKQIGALTNIENTISDKFLTIKDDFNRPFSSFTFNSTLINAADLDSSDWRKQYPGLGYDIVFNDKDNLYYLYYAAYNGTITQIGYMTSPDLETWTQASGNPILSPTGINGDPDKGGMTFPQLLRNGNEWILYYIGYSAQGFERGVHKICYATSNDLQNWTRHGAIIDTTMFHDDRVINVLYRPNVKNYNGKYYMFINAGTGDASPGGNTESIYVFISDRPVTGWTYLGKCVDSEILYASETYKIVSDPCVVKCTNSNYYYMFCWSREGIIGLYSRNDEFPMNWHYDKAMNAGVSRPLAVPTTESMILITNTDNASSFSKYVADWNLNNI